MLEARMALTQTVQKQAHNKEAQLIPTPLSNWRARAVEAYDDKGNPNFINSEGDIIPGIYLNLPNDVYHSLPALSSSGLKKFSDSPAKYYREYLSDVCRRKKASMQKSLNTGSLIHELVLETSRFYDEYCREPLRTDSEFEGIEFIDTAEQLKARLKELDLPVSGTKVQLIERLIEADPSAQVWELVRESKLCENGAPEQKVIDGKEVTVYGGRLPIDGVMWDDAMRCLQTIWKHQEASKIFTNGESEVAILAFCPQTGLALKCKFDWLRYDDCAADLKSTQSARPAHFIRKDIFGYRYDLQISFYSYVAACANIFIKEFPLVAVEFQDADIVQPYKIDYEAKKSADEEMMDYLYEFNRCKEESYWPGYLRKDEVIVVSRPKYM